MPSENATPIKSPPRNQRQTKALSSLPNGADNMQETPTPARSPTPNKQKRRNRNNRAQSKPNELPLGKNHPVSPLTPPRASNQLDMLPLDGNVSPIVPVQKSARSNKRRPNKSNLNNMSAPSIADPLNPSSVPTETPGSMTPVKSAPQMYAGPTFHASPAPSSLPIPKFFSRSAPPTDTEASLKATLNEETSEESSSAGDESPTLRNSVRAEERKICDPSPLDILFNADREEKARRHLASPASADHARAHSASPMSPSHRTHSDNIVTQSTLLTELEGSPYMISEGPRIESSPSVLLSNDTSSAQAKTAALKNLLSLPSPAHSGVWSTASTRGSSPASTPGPFTGTRRSVSGSSTPLYMPSSSSASPSYDSMSFLSSPSINSNGKRSSQARPMSSQLRQDVTNNLLADLNELPSSPSPSRYKLYKNPVEAHSGNIFSLQKPTTMKFQAEDALRATARGMSTKGAPLSDAEERRRQEAQGRYHAEIEANLRQILKVPL